MNSTKVTKQLKTLVTGQLPTLKNVLITADAETTKTHFTTSNLDSFTTVEAENTYSNTFEVTVNLKNLIAVISSLPKNSKCDILYSPETKKISINSAIGAFALATASRDSFPAIPEVNGKSIEISLETMQRFFKLLPFAADPKVEIRDVLAGIFYNAEKHELVATNGHYMGIEKNMNLGDKDFIVPATEIKSLMKMIKGSGFYGKKSTETISVNLQDKYITFNGTNFNITIRTIDGEYPPYWKVIPTRVQETMKLDSKVISEIPMKLLNQATHQIYIDNANGFTTFEAESEITKWSRKAGTTNADYPLAVNADLLQTVSSYMDTKELIMCLTDSSTAILMEDTNRLALLMPVRLPDPVK